MSTLSAGLLTGGTASIAKCPGHSVSFYSSPGMKSVLSVFLYLRISTRTQLAAIQTICRERSPVTGLPVCTSPAVAKLW